MSEHLLLARAVRFPISAPQDPDGWRYRREIGAWVSAGDPSVLMVGVTHEPGFTPTKPGQSPNEPRPQPPRPVSKKMDQETGEDMKGT